MNQFEDEQSNEIPVGPVEQTDDSPRVENAGANVQLKDLLSFSKLTFLFLSFLSLSFLW